MEVSERFFLLKYFKGCKVGVENLTVPYFQTEMHPFYFRGSYVQPERI